MKRSTTMDHDIDHTRHDISDDTFPTGVEGLVEATGPATLELADGNVLDLRIAPVTKRLDDATVRMLGYNGSIPGPTLRVRQGSEVLVSVRNDGGLETGGDRA